MSIILPLLICLVPNITPKEVPNERFVDLIEITKYYDEDAEYTHTRISFFYNSQINTTPAWICECYTEKYHKFEQELIKNDWEITSILVPSNLMNNVGEYRISHSYYQNYKYSVYVDGITIHCKKILETWKQPQWALDVADVWVEDWNLSYLSCVPIKKSWKRLDKKQTIVIIE